MRNIMMLSVLFVSMGLAGAVYAGGSAGCGCPLAKASGDLAANKAAVNAGNKICPVMGSAITSPGSVTVEYKGKAYNLCCSGCKETFLKDPEMYLKKVEAEMAPALKS